MDIAIAVVATWSVLLLVFVVAVLVYVFVIKDRLAYKRAKKEIFAFVKSYKRRCTGNNRFVVTVESLQNSFREYETKIIEDVWLDLINERVIEPDPQDSLWCVR